MNTNRPTATILIALLLALPAAGLVALAPTAAAAPPVNATSLTTTPSILSPANGDGFQDATTVTVRAQAGQTLYINIYDAANQLRRAGVPLLETTAGVYTARWDARLSGGVLANEGGSPYRLKVTTGTLGNPLNEAPLAATVEIDDTPPTGATVSINNGARFLTRPDATLAFGVAGATTGLQLRVAEGTADAALESVAWENFVATKPFTFTGADGLKTVRLQVRDAAGNVGTVATASTTLDRTAPTVSVAINGGATTVPSTAVTLSVTATDANGVTEMRVSNDGGQSFPAGWERFATTKSWSLAGTGAQSVLVQVRDGAGHTANATAATTVSGGLAGQGLLINGGAAFTTAAGGAVTLTLVNPQPGTFNQMAFSNTGVAGSFSAFEAFQTTKTWTLDASTDGPKTVYFRLRNTAGAVETVSATITLDRVAPTATLALNDAAGFGVTLTNANGVVLAVGGSDANGIQGARFSRTSAGIAAATFAPLTATTLVWCFEDDNPLAAARASLAACPASADGDKTLHYEVRDNAGLVSTRLVRTVARDATAPEYTALTVLGLTNGRTNAATLTLEPVAVGATQMSFSLDGGEYGAWQPFAASTIYTLPAAGRTDGAHTLAVRVRDAAGNVAPARTVAYTYDATGPTGTLTIKQGLATNPAIVERPDLTLELAASDAATGGSAVTAMRVWLGTSEPTTTEAFAATRALALPNVPGTYTVNVRFFDEVGNPSALLSRNVVLIERASLPPLPAVCTGLDFTLPGQYTRTRAITLGIAATADVAGLAVGVGARSTTFGTPGATVSHELPAGDGTHQVYVTLRLADGTLCELGPKAIILDTVAPQTGAPADATAWRRAGFTLTLAAADATSGVARVTWELDGGATQEGPLVTIPATLADGEHTLTFRATDAAGNVEADRTITLRLDSTPPAAVVAGAADGTKVNATYSLTLSATDAGSGIAEVRYRVGDTGAFIALRAAPYVAALSLPQGEHTVHFYAVDVAGNEGPVSTVRLVNVLPPTPDAHAASAAEAVGAAGERVSVDLAGDAPVVGAQLVIPGAGRVTIRALVQDATGRSVPGDLLYSLLDIRAVDDADADVPVGAVTLRFNVSLAWLQYHGVQPTQVVLLHQKGAAWEALRARVVAQDEANVTLEASTTSLSPFAIVADKTAPTFSNALPADGTTVAPGARVSVAVADAVGGLTFEVTIDGEDRSADATYANGVLNLGTPSLAAGKHEVRVRATDAAGNVAEHSWAFTVQAAPTPADGCAAMRVAGGIEIRCPDGADASRIQVFVNGVPYNVTRLEKVDGGYRLDPSKFSEGQHELRVVYTDETGQSRTTTETFQGTATEPEGRFPWVLVVLGILAVAAIVAGVVLQRRRKD